MRKLFQMIALVLVVLALSLNSSFAQKVKPPESQRLVTAYKKFSFQLFEEIVKKDLNKNIFISPTSVALALAMTYNGAGGETQKAMAQVLGFQGMSLEEVNRANASLKDALLNPDADFALKIANSLWGNKQVKFAPAFLQRNGEFYGAHLEALDFADPQSASVINARVSRQTEGKIPTVLDKVNPGDLLFLINAIYFKGKWHQQFNKSQTKDHSFTLLSGRKKDHPMMFQTGNYVYYRGSNYQAVRLPYKSTGSKKILVMDIFLPDKGVSLQDFSRNFSNEEWERWREGSKEEKGRIGLPRFELRYKVTLNKSLQNLGMGLAFGGKANFRQMTSIPAYISDVIHDTFVKVDEKGTEAAAATTVRFKITMKPISKPKPKKIFEMIMDRPFIFVISDTQSGAILFIGSIVDPK